MKSEKMKNDLEWLLDNLEQSGPLSLALSWQLWKLLSNLFNTNFWLATYLSRELQELALNREHPLDDVVVPLTCPGQDLFKRQGVVLRSCQVLDLVSFDVAFLAADHVFQVERSDNIFWWTVRFHLLNDKVVRLCLRLELTTKLCHRYADLLTDVLCLCYTFHR